MESDYDFIEIATVIRDFWLIDSESYQRKYSTRHGKPIVPGHYVVKWPDHIRSRRFNEHAEFYGPFASHREAEEIGYSMSKNRTPYKPGLWAISSRVQANAGQLQ
jgi:hypothetical protein